MQLDICTPTLVACPVRPFCLTFWSTCPTLFYPDMSLNELLGTSTFPRHLRSCHEILHSLWQLKPWTALLNTQRDISRGHLSESVSVLSSCTEWRRQTGEWLVSFSFFLLTCLLVFEVSCGLFYPFSLPFYQSHITLCSSFCRLSVASACAHVDVLAFKTCLRFHRHCYM